MKRQGKGKERKSAVVFCFLQIHFCCCLVPLDGDNVHLAACVLVKQSMQMVHHSYKLNKQYVLDVLCFITLLREKVQGFTGT